MIVDPLLQAYAVRTATLGSRARVLTVQLMGGGAEGDDATAESIDGAEVLQPMGLFVRPFLTARTEAIGMELGDEVVVLALIDKSGGGGASAVPFSDVDQGETRLYGAKEAAARLRLRADGSLDLEVKAAMPLRITHPSGAKFWINGDGSIDVLSAPGKAVNIDAGGAGDIVLNGGTKQVAREEDTLNVGTLVGTAGPWPVVFAYVPGVAGAAAPAPPGGVALSGVILTGTGAARTKG